ncbi:MAG: hypothetical protein GJU72_13115 [Acidithiobacillus ferriphilus]|jgi:hypothetical protein|nr:hypothetical protein [Acidithiobacillus ferriphilus]MBW9254430.1 hypothetical protein [Acidithiobacillus ferriphilus]
MLRCSVVYLPILTGGNTNHLSVLARVLLTNLPSLHGEKRTAGPQQHERSGAFDYCSYGLRMPIPLSNPPVALLCNYPVAWAEHYKARNYLAIDPTVR